jgi:hypothetical protein
MVLALTADGLKEFIAVLNIPIEDEPNARRRAADELATTALPGGKKTSILFPACTLSGSRRDITAKYFTCANVRKSSWTKWLDQNVKPAHLGTPKDKVPKVLSKRCAKDAQKKGIPVDELVVDVEEAITDGSRLARGNLFGFVRPPCVDASPDNCPGP